MRTKSESRRRAIIEAAAEVFRERGFESATMSEIAARVGGSKATLYGYFPSKEALFATVMVEQVKAQADPLVQSFVAADDIVAAVRCCYPVFMRMMLSPEIKAVNRMCVAEGERSGFGPTLFEVGPKPAWTAIAARLERAMDEGQLRRADPWVAAMHMKALGEADIVDACLRGWREPPSEAEIERAAEAAADCFLRAYAP